MKERGHADTGVIDACIELCDSLNGEALKSLHSEEPDEAMVCIGARAAELHHCAHCARDVPGRRVNLRLTYLGLLVAGSAEKG
jgi:hypothetical protein